MSWNIRIRIRIRRPPPLSIGVVTKGGQGIQCPKRRVVKAEKCLKKEVVTYFQNSTQYCCKNHLGSSHASMTWLGFPEFGTTFYIWNSRSFFLRYSAISTFSAVCFTDATSLPCIWDASWSTHATPPDHATLTCSSLVFYEGQQPPQF